MARNAEDGLGSTAVPGVYLAAGFMVVVAALAGCDDSSGGEGGSYAPTDHDHTLAGDVTGPTGATTVTAVQGRPVSDKTPGLGYVLKWSSGEWTPAPDADSGGDITAVTAGTGLTGGGTYGAVVLSAQPHSGDVTGTTALTVKGIQGRPVSAAAPGSGQVLKWNGSVWELAADDTGAAGGGTVDSIVPGGGVAVDDTDAANPVVDLKLHAGGGLASNLGIGIDELGLMPGTADSQVLKWNAAGSTWELATDQTGGGGGAVDSVVAGAGIAVDSTDPVKPEVGLTDGTAVGDILKWDGSTWGLAPDETGGAGTDTLQDVCDRGSAVVLAADAADAVSVTNTGSSNGSTAVRAITDATTGISTGVYGFSNSNAGYGVYARSNNIGLHARGTNKAAEFDGLVDALGDVSVGGALTLTNDPPGAPMEAATKKYVDDSVAAAGGGDITGVTAGAGLTGGGPGPGDVTLDVSFGTAAGTVAEGNHAHTLQQVCDSGGTATKDVAGGATISAANTSSTGNSIGLHGYATAGTGATYGVYGRSDSSSGQGVYGWTNSATGITYGVHGTSDSEAGSGVYGHARRATGTTYGVRGESDSSEGYGVHASGNNVGLYATGTNKAAEFVGQVDVTGDLNVTGTVTGDGSGLTNVTATEADTLHTVVNRGNTATVDLAGGGGVDVLNTNVAGYGVVASAPIAIRATGGTKAAEFIGQVDVTGDLNVSGTITGDGSGLGNVPEADTLQTVCDRGRTAWTSLGGGATISVENTNSTDGSKGIVGLASAPTGVTYGVYGQSDSDSGYGFYGLAPYMGVSGIASGTTGSTYGVYGRSAGNAGRGVHGAATSATGTTYGVYGTSSSSAGRGVYGVANAASGTTYGVYGSCSSPTGYGVYSQGRMHSTGAISTDSTALATNLNADMVDDYHAADLYRDNADFTTTGSLTQTGTTADVTVADDLTVGGRSYLNESVTITGTAGVTALDISASSQYGVRCLADSGTSGAPYYGIYDRITGTGTGAKIALQVESTGTGGVNYGVQGSASGGTQNYGVYGSTSGAGTNYAVYANGRLHATGAISTDSTALVTNLNADMVDGSHANALKTKFTRVNYSTIWGTSPVPTAWTKLGDIGSFDKDHDATTTAVEVIWTENIYFTSPGGVRNVQFEARIDGIAPVGGTVMIATGASGTIYETFTFYGYFTSLGAGPHTVSLWVCGNQTDTQYLVNPGGYSKSVIMKEVPYR